MAYTIPGPGTATGYTSAPGGGGVSLYGLGWNFVDLTDGSWTLTDPDSLVQSVSHSSGYNTVTWNALTGSNNYNWSSGTTIRAPRWHKAYSIDGTAIDADELLTFSLFGAIDTTVNDFDQQVIGGLGADLTATATDAVEGSGMQMDRQTTGVVEYGPWAYNAASTSGAGGSVTGLVSVVRGGLSVGAGVGLGLDGSDVAVNNQQRLGGRFNQIASGAAIHVFIGVGIRTNTVNVANGDQQKFRIGYRGVSWDLSGI